MLTAEWRMRNEISEQQEFRSQETEARRFYLLNSEFWILDSLFTIYHS